MGRLLNNLTFLNNFKRYFYCFPLYFNFIFLQANLFNGTEGILCLDKQKKDKGR